MFEKDWRVRIDHIADCIGHLEKMTVSLSKAEFDANLDIYRAVERNIEIIAEAVKHFPPGVLEEHPEIPWRDIVDTRNIIAHLYEGVDEDILWDIVRSHIPPLKETILKMKKKYKGPGT